MTNCLTIPGTGTGTGTQPVALLTALEQGRHAVDRPSADAGIGLLPGIHIARMVRFGGGEGHVFVHLPLFPST